MKKIFSTSSLKIIACITMLVDHIGSCLLNNLYIMRVIGRIAFPLFAFCVVIGWSKTRSKKKYFSRLFILGVISQFITVFLNPSLNILFTLLLGLLSIEVFQQCSKFKGFKNEDYQNTHPHILSLIKNVLPFLSLLFLCILAELIGADYGAYGILLIFILFYFKSDALMLCFFFILLNFGKAISNSVLLTNQWEIYLQCFSMLSVIFILLYNGKKGINLKWAFYAFYPLHLLAILLLKVFVF